MVKEKSEIRSETQDTKLDARASNSVDRAQGLHFKMITIMTTTARLHNTIQAARCQSKNHRRLRKLNPNLAPTNKESEEHLVSKRRN